MIMKRIAVFTAVFVLGVSLASAQTRQPFHFSNPLLNEVVRMSNAGIENDTIIAYVKARQARLGGDIMAEDLIALREAGVGEPVIRFLASVTGFAGPKEPGGVATYEAGEGETVAVDVGDGYGYGYGYPYWGWGWGWDGWWGYPYFSGSVVIGGGHGHGHGGHGGGGHGGGGRGGGHGGGGHGGGGHGGGGRGGHR